MQVDLRIDNGLVVTMNQQRSIIKDCSVIIDKGQIIEVAKPRDLRAGYEAKKHIDARGMLVMPGLVDVHLHNVQQLSRGLADDVDLITWVYERILPYESCLTEEDVYLSALLTCIEKIRTGTTCAADPGGYLMDNVGRAYEEAGLRGIISWAGMDRWPGDRNIPDSLPGKKGTRETLYEMERLVKDWHNTAGGRIRASYALRTEPNVSEELFKATWKLAERDGVLIQMHTAVSPRQVSWMKEHTGLTSIEYLNSLGILGPQWLLAHMAWVTEQEVELLARHDVKIAHQPGASVHGTYGAISKGKIPEMLAAGITVGIGCDANSADNTLDMFRNIYLTATLHKEVRLDAQMISPEKALEMATIDAAKALMWEREIGSLEPGKRADVIILDIKQSNWLPVFDFSLIPNLVYAAEGRDVVTNIVDGQILMENRIIKTIDVEDVLERAQQAATRILTKLPYKLRPVWPVQ